MLDFDSMPRAHRVRFTVPRARMNPQRARATKTLEGVTSYRHSMAGRAARAEQLAEQWQRQNGLCHRCRQRVGLGAAKFANARFNIGEVNHVVHKGTCPKQGVAA